MKLWKLVFIAWVLLWVLFLFRDLVIKGNFGEYITLCKLNMEEKRSYILGKELNAFLGVCEKEIPPTGTYKIVGNLDEHNKYRLVYYLYPRTQSEDPDYIITIYPKTFQYILTRLR